MLSIRKIAKGYERKIVKIMLSTKERKIQLKIEKCYLQKIEKNNAKEDRTMLSKECRKMLSMEERK